MNNYDIMRGVAHGSISEYLCSLMHIFKMKQKKLTNKLKCKALNKIFYLMSSVVCIMFLLYE